MAALPKLWRGGQTPLLHYHPLVPFQPKGDCMAVPIAVTTTVLAVVLVFVLAREIRLRRAFESLLRRLLTYWRTPCEYPRT